MTDTDYAGASDATASDATEGDRVYTVMGGDWDTVLGAAAGETERIIVNMGPQHPSTHGVLRMVLELDGETVVQNRPGIGYLHTGIEKNMEFRTWTQGVTFVTRMDYLTPFHNETAYCLGIERLLGITDEIPQRASVIRVMMMELGRVSNHLVALAAGGLELGALTAMTQGFRDRELILDIFEAITGLRMNHAYIRPGGVKEDLPHGIEKTIVETIAKLRKLFVETTNILVDNKIWMGRNVGIGYLDLSGCMALGVTGPILRATGLPWDLRKDQPYCGYENYELNIPTETTCDAYGRFLIRIAEMTESLNVVEQCLDKLTPGPVMVADPRVAWPSQLTVGSDGQGNSLDHIRKIMSTSMEALIHHFKLVTEGFRVPAGQVYSAVESPKGELGAHIVSDGGTRPYRVHYRDPSFANLQSIAAMTEGGFLSDVVACVASIDPVMGGVDR